MTTATTEAPTRALAEYNRTAAEHEAEQARIAAERAELARLRDEVAEWQKLRDPVTLHVNLLRGFPAKLDRATFMHLAGYETPDC